MAANQHYEYDSRGNVISKTDWEGNKTTYHYNDRNLETLRVEAVGSDSERVVETRWHAEFAVPTRIAEPQQDSRTST